MLTQKVTATRRSATIEHFSFSRLQLQIRSGRNLKLTYIEFLNNKYTAKMLDINVCGCMNTYFLIVSTLSEKKRKEKKRRGLKK
jgi:hypothetical protein